LSSEGGHDPFTGKAGITFAYLPGTHGGIFDRATYSHEVGHVLSTSETNQRLPRALTSLGSTWLARESMSDLLAIDMNGAVFSDSEILPLCLSRTRVISRDGSYDLPEKFFTHRWGTESLLRCCSELKATLPAGSPWTRTCDELARLLPPPSSQGSEQSKPFDPEALKSDRTKFDPHQLGIPLNSFIEDLGASTGRPSRSLWIKAFQKASEPKTRYPEIRCELQGFPPLLLHEPSMTNVFEAYRSQFREKPVFDSLWARHGMDKAVQLARQDELERLHHMVALPHFYRALKARLVTNLEPPRCRLSDLGSAPEIDRETSVRKYLFPPVSPNTKDARPGCQVSCSYSEDGIVRSAGLLTEPAESAPATSAADRAN
jgi:hypothetical protein